MNTDKAQQAIGVAIELFGKNGIDNTSTQSIAKQAKIGNATLFKYFKNKEELIRQAYLSSKLDQVAATKRNLVPSDSFEILLRRVWINLIEWCLENPNKFRFNMKIKNSRFADPEIDQKADDEFLFFRVAMHSAKANGQIIDVSDELIFSVMMSFLEIAISFERLESSAENEGKVYDLMLNSLKISKSSE